MPLTFNKIFYNLEGGSGGVDGGHRDGPSASQAFCPRVLTDVIDDLLAVLSEVLDMDISPLERERTELLIRQLNSIHTRAGYTPPEATAALWRITAAVLESSLGALGDPRWVGAIREIWAGNSVR